MSRELSTPVLTTVSRSGAGFLRGCRRRGGFTPCVPGREHVSKAARAKVPCGRIWPNGEFGLSYHNRTDEQDPLPLREPGPNRLPGETLRKGLFWSLCEQWVVARATWDFLAWLVKSPKSAQRAETYGRKGITAYGQKTVRSGAYLLQDRYGKDRLSFVTLTVPDFAHYEAAIIASKWSYLMKALLQALRRLLAKVGLPTSIVAVTELQPERLKAENLGCLHVHLVCVGAHQPFAWEYSPFVFRALWLRLLSNVLNRELSCFPCENVERVKKDASQYLSKYMSKGVADIGDYAGIEGWEMVPRQWWTATKSVKAAVKKYTITGEFAASMLDEVIHTWQCGGYQPKTLGVEFCRPITIKATLYQDYLIGFFGKLDRETYDDIRQLTCMLKSG